MTNDVLWFVKPSLAFEWSTLYYLDIRQRKQEWLQTNILRRNSKKINAKLKIGPRVAAIAQWIHLRLPSRRPGFEYQTHQLRFYQIIFDLRHVEKTKINKKRSGLAHFKKGHTQPLFAYSVFSAAQAILEWKVCGVLFFTLR